MSARVVPNLGCATTRELLDELDARNRVGQGDAHEKLKEQASEHIRKLKLAFSLRYNGLEYRTVDE